jgi:hypothetical protein
MGALVARNFPTIAVMFCGAALSGLVAQHAPSASLSQVFELVRPQLSGTDTVLFVEEFLQRRR